MVHETLPEFTHQESLNEFPVELLPLKKKYKVMGSRKAASIAAWLIACD